MPQPVNALKFHLERLLLRGAHYRLGLMAMAVVGVSVLGGGALVALQEGSFSESAWWAFLRLTDPGYLGDDEGVGRRLVSVLITVAGYVLFMGALIAILTEWLHSTIRRLQRGETPIAMKDHLLVLGLTERSPVVIEEILASEGRVKRFLAGRGVSTLSLVVLVEHLDETVRADLVERLGKHWDDRKMVLRSGTPLDAEHLDRVAFEHAAAILMPGSSRGTNARTHDAMTIKTVLAIAAHPRIRAATQVPRLVAEVADPLLARTLGKVYPGVLEVIPGDAVVSQLFAQNLRHTGLSWVLVELLALQNGKNLILRDFAETHGRPFGEVLLRLRGGLALGFVREVDGEWEPHLDPSPDTVLEPGDRLVTIAVRYEDLTFAPASTQTAAVTGSAPPVQLGWPETRRVLLLGWNRRVPVLLQELQSYAAESFAVDVLSVISPEDRTEACRAAGVSLDGLELRHFVGDYTNVVDLRVLDLTRYHNVAILGRGWLDAEEVADAQTVVCYAILQQLLPETDRPALLVELMDPADGHLFENKPGEVMYSPEILGRMVAHVALRRELHAVMRALFTAGGPEFHYRPPAHYGIEGRTLTFAELQREAQRHGEIAVGVRTSDAELDVRGDLELAPDPDHSFTLGPQVLLLVLTRDVPRRPSPSGAPGAAGRRSA